MVIELRHSTAVKLIVDGLFDATDGVTPETAVTLSACDAAELFKHNTAAVTDLVGHTWTYVTANQGYALSLSAADVDTHGNLKVVLKDTDVFVPHFENMQVVNEQYWDSKYGTDYQQVHIVEIDAGAVSAGALGADCITAAKIADDAIAAEHVAANTIVAATLAADCITEAKIADNAIAAEHIAANAITSAKIANATLQGDKFGSDFISAGSILADSIGVSELASAVVDKIQSAVHVRLVDSSTTHLSAVQNANTMARGKFTKASNDYQFFKDDDTTSAFKTVISAAGRDAGV